MNNAASNHSLNSKTILGDSFPKSGIIESLVSDAGDAFANGDRGQTGATFESRVSDAGDAVGFSVNADRRRNVGSPDFGNFSRKTSFLKKWVLIYNEIRIFHAVIWVTHICFVSLHHVCAQEEKQVRNDKYCRNR